MSDTLSETPIAEEWEIYPGSKLPAPLRELMREAFFAGAAAATVNVMGSEDRDAAIEALKQEFLAYKPPNVGKLVTEFMGMSKAR